MKTMFPFISLAVVYCFLLLNSCNAFRTFSPLMKHKSIVGLSHFSSGDTIAVRSSLRENNLSGMQLSASNEGEVETAADGFDPAAWLNPNTRGGVLVWAGLLTLIPVGFYNFFVSTGMEETTVGAYVGAIFVLLSNLLWASTYIFRVANKDMTYAKQLRDYENAVLQKRLEELADDEINALMEEIEQEEAAAGRPSSVNMNEQLESTATNINDGDSPSV